MIGKIVGGAATTPVSYTHLDVYKRQGLARVLMLMLQQSSIREVTYLFRGPTRLLP